MEEILIQFQEFSSTLGFFFGFLFIVAESIIPVLPLSVFIALNVIAFGPLMGFILSYVATIIGCIISFLLARKLYTIYFHKKIKKDGRVNRLLKRVNKWHFSNLVLIIALPFTPAFLINISAGLAEMDFKKFLASILIGKLSIVYFWGFVGESLLESINDPSVLIRLAILVLVVYIISKVVSRESGIE